MFSLGELIASHSLSRRPAIAASLRLVCACREERVAYRKMRPLLASRSKTYVSRYSEMRGLGKHTIIITLHGRSGAASRGGGTEPASFAHFNILHITVSLYCVDGGAGKRRESRLSRTIPAIYLYLVLCGAFFRHYAREQHQLYCGKGDHHWEETRDHIHGWSSITRNNNRCQVVASMTA